MTPEKTPAEIAAAVLRALDEHPEQYDQEQWCAVTPCGTTSRPPRRSEDLIMRDFVCFHVRLEGHPQASWPTIPRRAKELLGGVCDALFEGNRTEEEVRTALGHIALGDVEAANKYLYKL